MPAPKDPIKRKIWIENMSKSKTKPKIHKVCSICGEPFDVIPSKKNRKCCSIECRGKLQSGKNNPMFGKKRPDTAERNRQHSGEKHPMFGKKRPDVAEQMMGEKNHWYGKHPSQEARDKMSEAKIGEKCSNYIDGRSYEPYTIEFNKQLKELIRSRDGYKCQKCGCPEIEEDRKLSIHHINYNKKNCLPENLITLCKRCNAIVNTNRRKWTKYFQKKVGKKQKQSQLCLSIS